MGQIATRVVTLGVDRGQIATRVLTLEVRPQTLIIEAEDSSSPAQQAEAELFIETRPPAPEEVGPGIAPPPAPVPPPLAPALRLVLEGGPQLILDDVPLLHITEVDYGFPEPREVREPKNGSDGVNDRTQFVNGRVVTLTGKIGIDWPFDRDFGPRDSTMGGQRQQIMNRLGPFLHPGRRPWLYSRFDDGSVKRIRLRADNFSRPQIADVQDISISFKSVGAGFEDEEPVTVRVVPEVEIEGREYDLSFDRVYPPGSGTAVRVDNQGDTDADWMAKVYGPCRGAEVINVSTGERVVIAGLDIPQGHYLEIDVAQHTVRADGLAENSRWGSVDFAHTTWWKLPPGESFIRLRVEEWTVPTQMLFSWRSTSLLQ